MDADTADVSQWRTEISAHMKGLRRVDASGTELHVWIQLHHASVQFRDLAAASFQRVTPLLKPSLALRGPSRDCAIHCALDLWEENVTACRSLVSVYHWPISGAMPNAAAASDI